MFYCTQRNNRSFEELYRVELSARWARENQQNHLRRNNGRISALLHVQGQASFFILWVSVSFGVILVICPWCNFHCKAPLLPYLQLYLFQCKNTTILLFRMPTTFVWKSSALLQNLFCFVLIAILKAIVVKNSHWFRN